MPQRTNFPNTCKEGRTIRLLTFTDSLVFCILDTGDSAFTNTSSSTVSHFSLGAGHPDQNSYRSFLSNPRQHKGGKSSPKANPPSLFRIIVET